MALKVTPKKKVAEDPRHTQALQHYEAGLRALQEHKFEKAKASLQKALTGPDKALVDRAHVHLATCEQHAEKPALHFKTPGALRLRHVADEHRRLRYGWRAPRQTPEAAAQV
jgi:Tfp pilus assembly protein PilF